MGIWGALGKMAGSKVIEKVESELTKKQNREQTSGYCNYIKSNLVRIYKQIADLENETKALIGEVSALKGVKLSFKEKGALRKTKEKTESNLKYLYLARDFFTALAKNASGLILSNEELDLVIKFVPFFDGVPVLDGVDVEIPVGRTLAVLGPNGSGKSTLMRAMLGIVSFMVPDLVSVQTKRFNSSGLFTDSDIHAQRFCFQNVIFFKIRKRSQSHPI